MKGDKYRHLSCAVLVDAGSAVDNEVIIGECAKIVETIEIAAHLGAHVRSELTIVLCENRPPR